MHVSAKYNVPPSAVCASGSGAFFPELHNLIRFERKDGAYSGSDRGLVITTRFAADLSRCPNDLIQADNYNKKKGLF